ncbi:hypothetical protein ABC345_21025 [Shouchella sp. 1P09AA]|uniref:hypothetical protein n=1 Tax=unclassified Shouchella TaxID=2893065 RepID=UPI0039A1C409
MFDVIMNSMMLGAANGMDNLINTGQDILTWVQRAGIISAALGFCVGAFYLIFGGDRGRSKSVGWFIGGAVGLIVLMGAEGIASGIDDNINF